MIDDAIITINGDKVYCNSNKYPQYNFETTIPTLIGAMGSASDKDSGLLPPAVRWISNDRNTLVLERPPLYVPLYYTPTDKISATGVDRENKEKYDLPLPWQVYIVTVEPTIAVKSFFRNSCLQSMDDPICEIPLPNANGHCLPYEYGADLKEMMDGGYTLADALNFAVNYMWTTNFNTNAGQEAHSIPPEFELCDYSSTWGEFFEKWSAYTPVEILTVTWRESGANLEAYIKANIDAARGYRRTNQNRGMDSQTIAYNLRMVK